MAILGKIRQRSIFLIIVIGMALFAFVISGVFDGNNANNGPTDPVALINGEEIKIDFFRQMVDQTQRNYNYSTLKSVNLVWNQALRNTIFEQEFKKLGIDAGKDQLEQIRTEVGKFIVEGDLRREVATNIKRLQDLGTNRGIRHRRHLPVRGQKTKNNARTRKGPKRPIRR